MNRKNYPDERKYKQYQMKMLINWIESNFNILCSQNRTLTYKNIKNY